MFIDEAQIHVRSGKGGDGVVHFRREKYVPYGGPDGGDGGKGGDAILEVRPALNTLVAFRHQARFKADDGQRGARSNMTGRSAEDLIIPIPPGTIISDAMTGEVLGDLVEPGQRLVVCKGGRGGRGNARFANSRNQVPRIAERGEPFQERSLKLELKLIADVGIVGVPNAGKSTFLSVVTNAKPKIAPYPFTTIEPNLGVADLGEGLTLVLADIPGLIEGAHMGIGLGHDFLRHVQRTRVLIHLLDGLAEDPVMDFAQINSELALFDPNLASKPQVVALNKMDLPDVQARWPSVEAALKRLGHQPLAISAAAGTNVKPLLYQAVQLLQSTPPVAEIAATPVYRVEADPKHFTIEQTPEGWRVHGEAIERAAAMTYWEFDDSVRRFQHILETLGVDRALREAGVQEGDTVFIGEHELEWSD
ncbi:MAG TPA: GTPase ObgE [Anaerolineales bacterium]|nr:GTPase ObgE [Anaerolineales bacterium]